MAPYVGARAWSLVAQLVSSARDVGRTTSYDMESTSRLLDVQDELCRYIGRLESENLEIVRASRPSGRSGWDDYFLEGAHWVGTRSTCPKRSVGAIIVKNHHVVSTGYNGAPPGAPHCSDVGCKDRDGHCIRTVHAEENAILHTSVRSDLVGATLYIDNGTPCYHCAVAIASTGIERIVCRGSYPDDDALEVLSSLSIVVETE